MRCLPALLIALLAVGADARAARDPLPQPAGLDPAVAFWVRIYSDVDTKGGLIHDAVNLDVVYEKIAFSWASFGIFAFSMRSLSSSTSLSLSSLRPSSCWIAFIFSFR